MVIIETLLHCLIIHLVSQKFIIQSCDYKGIEIDINIDIYIGIVIRTRKRKGK